MPELRRSPGASTESEGSLPRTRRLSPPAARSPRWYSDLETVALALSPDRWAELRAHLGAALLPSAAPPPPDDRAARLSAFAQLLRARQERPGVRGPLPADLCRDERRLLGWRRPHLAFLHRGS